MTETFRIGEKVLVISANLTGVIIEIDYIEKTATVDMDDPEAFAIQWMPIEKYQLSKEQAAKEGRKPIAKMYTDFSDLRHLLVANPEWKGLWDQNE